MVTVVPYELGSDNCKYRHTTMAAAKSNGTENDHSKNGNMMFQ